MSRSQPELTMVFVVRKDLKLSRGKLAAQCSHAAADCVLKASRANKRELDRYLAEGARKIVCEAKDEEALRRLFGEAKEAGVVASLVKDAGHTEIPSGTVTVVGIGPGPRDEIDSITGALPLVS